MNLLDRAINYVSPAWALKREQARIAASLWNASYAGASLTSRKMQHWLPAKGSANADYSQEEQSVLIARCRDAHRNQSLARAAVDRLKHNVVGGGLKLQSHIDWEVLGISQEQASAQERLIESEFEHWCKHCDLERTLSFSKLQALCLVSMLISGDVFVNTPFVERPECEYGLKLQVIEADRVNNPNFGLDTTTLRRGVELDEWGAPAAYHIMSQHPGDDLLTEWHWDRFTAFGEQTGQRRIFHVFEKERSGQTRGVPYLAPVLEPLKQMERYTDAELTAAVVASLFTVFVQSESGFTLSQATESTPSGPLEKDQINLGPGAIVNLLPGETVQFANPNRPNTAYDPFMQALLRQVGAALSLPVELLQLSFLSSYSAARAALLQAWKLICFQRSIMVEQLCQPVFELWFDEFIARGKLELPNYDNITKWAYTRATWIGPARGAIDENKEVQAARDRIELGISSRQIEAEELQGVDWLDIHKELMIEQKLRREAGLELTAAGAPARLPVPVLSAEEIDQQEALAARRTW